MCSQASKRSQGVAGLRVDAALRSVTLLAQQLGRETEVVVQGFPKIAIQGVDPLAQLRGLQLFVTQQLAHMRLVLLLHMTVIILVIGSRSREPYPIGAVSKVAHQMPVQELPRFACPSDCLRQAISAALRFTPIATRC